MRPSTWRDSNWTDLSGIRVIASIFSDSQDEVDAVMKVTQLPFFQHVNWSPDRYERRRFAVSMLVGFAALGLLVAWRARDLLGTSTFILWGIGIALAVTALVPGLGRAVYLGVYLPTSLVGYVVSHVILTLMFFLVFVPIGLVLRLTGKDLLRLRPLRERAVWTRLDPVKDPESYYRQF